VHGVDDKEARARLGRFGLDGARHLVTIADLSGGQKARVVLASLALQRPHILVLDEVRARWEGSRGYQGWRFEALQRSSCPLGRRAALSFRVRDGGAGEGEGTHMLHSSYLTSMSHPLLSFILLSFNLLLHLE
jgi:hypothetical protein